MNMKQDRRLHIKNLIMNDPETIKVTSNETTFFHTTMQTTFWEIWVEVYAWLGVRWAPHLPRRPLMFENASMPLNWVLRIIWILKGKT